MTVACNSYTCKHNATGDCTKSVVLIGVDGTCLSREEGGRDTKRKDVPEHGKEEV